MTSRNTCRICGAPAIAYHKARDGTHTPLCERHVPTIDIEEVEGREGTPWTGASLAAVLRQSQAMTSTARAARMESYHVRAEELRAIAEDMQDEDAKQTMLRTAISYEQLAAVMQEADAFCRN